MRNVSDLFERSRDFGDGGGEEAAEYLMGGEVVVSRLHSGLGDGQVVVGNERLQGGGGGGALLAFLRFLMFFNFLRLEFCIFSSLIGKLVGRLVL